MKLASPPDDALELKNLVLRGECVAFVGAGLSIPPGRDWEGLVKDVANHCSVSFDNGGSLPEIIDKCIKVDERGCNEVLRDSLPRHIATTRTGIGYLHRLPLKAILTTNFDPWIRQQSRQERYQRYHIYPDLPLHCGLDSGIYYLHGYFDSGDMTANIHRLVFGERSFREAYEESLLPGFLLNVFVYENILFIAFDPTEEHVSRLLLQSMSIRRAIDSLPRLPTDMPKKRFALWPAPVGKTPEERETEYAGISRIRSLEVTPVFYDRGGSDYRGLEELLYSWIQEGELKDRPAPFSTGFDLSSQSQAEEA